MLLAVALGNPADRSVLLLGGVLHEGAFVADALIHRQHTIGEGSQAGDHLENRAWLCTGLGGKIPQRPAFIQQDVRNFLAACHHGVQIVGGVLGHGQHLAGVDIHHHHGAGLGQLQGVLKKVPAFQLGLVVVAPAVPKHFLFLDVPGQLHVVGNGPLGLPLVAVDNGQLNVVAVRGLGVGQLPGQPALVVYFHDPAASAAGDVGGEPIFHGALHPVLANGVIEGITHGAQLGCKIVAF